MLPRRYSFRSFIYLYLISLLLVGGKNLDNLSILLEYLYFPRVTITFCIDYAVQSFTGRYLLRNSYSC